MAQGRNTVRANRALASGRISSSPGAAWKSTGRPVTAMLAKHWPIPKCFSFRIGWKECARSMSARSGRFSELMKMK